MAIATINPATGETVKEFTPHDAAETDRRIGEAQAAFEALHHTTFAERAAWMRAAADLVEADADELARILTLEMGKPLAQAKAEALKCAKNMRFYAEHAEGFLADEPLADPSSVGASRAYARYQPLGVVLAVMPWNYPLWQVIRFAAPALMAGNTGVLKHASNVPQAALYLDTVFERGGFPVGSFRALLIGSREVEAVIRDPRVKAVTLTGSEPAGRSVASIAGAEIKKSVMELGGSDPFIVMPSADLEAAAAKAVTARVQNNGQSCIAAKRFLVHSEVYDAFAALFAEKMRALVVGDPTDAATDVGPVATASGRDDLAELVDDAIAKGATVLAGGKAVEGPGWFYEPTLLTDLSDDMRIVLEETFGPVASLYRFESREEALRIANQTTFGLSSAVWTTDAADEEYFVRELEAGAVFINGMTISYPELPFGGIKASGFGRELAAEGIREFCNVKTVWKG
ncbi:NADP-dependent succinic semialdehyde dehydrogenase [Galbitalea soli]|uniref:NADP-dependent succinic semialdehyde dehydrogenase n=1 Tax=Galbitalea soli TaxID=1268042 RepID=A0A7C9TT01_9MICO|nr:NADP-dependent succinic semialdehyde dehydrogenase [Galbitalea soli]NEM92361.1 NADP-dependent succinic semialdehyde dehydrogenase [Galbitalea soli]NYJ31682.1 succinate-semialdehyde dehydrogenase/glutarate-semialdehyde dehydrogenase [Galbitalea soli]